MWVGQMKAKALGLIALGMMIGGVICLAIHWDGDYGRIGTLMTIMGGQAAISSYFAGKRGTLDDAFEAGYQAGFHRGERVKPKVIRLPIERRREPALHRSSEPS